MKTKIYNYEKNLSTGDVEIIKMHSVNGQVSDIARKSLMIIAILFGGLHNASQTQLAKFDYTNKRYTEYCFYGSMATIDDNMLTRLVLLAHDMAIRIELKPWAFQYVKLMFHQRKRTGRFFEKHPSMEQALDEWRKL